METDLYPHQKIAVRSLRPGSILVGGTGSGKTRTSIAYYFEKFYPKKLYIITTARNRDSLKFEKDCALFNISKNLVMVDSWNNIGKYENINDAFFIFDEQRLVGYGKWVHSFLKIAKKNTWILLSATPGDNWSDYIAVFVANGFYRNKTHFLAEHAIFKPYSKYPQIIDYRNKQKLNDLKRKITVSMDYKMRTERHIMKQEFPCYESLTDDILKRRWNPYSDEPIKNISELCQTLRHALHDCTCINRKERILDLYFNKHKRIIIFYNFNYELTYLKEMAETANISYAEWNGMKHNEIPKSDSWLYFVQYIAGAEGWDCTETDAMIFYSLNYSYKIMKQSSGRIDRLTTNYKDLYYYIFYTTSKFDKGIMKALLNKEKFNETKFVECATQT